ncbi:MAG: amidohydrolase [Candidatus Limnocylindria bacterium]
MAAVKTPLREDLVALSREIHADPEIAYQERRAADRIAALLQRHGHRVERPYGGLETAFRARVGPAHGPAVALLAEYDALKGIGHGCGHNLIAMSNIGAFLLAAERASSLQIGIELIGTPAEEDGGGKVDLIRAGAFTHVAAALSSHPSSSDVRWGVSGTGLGVVGKRVVYHGLASHAGSAPEKGRNALNGVIRLFVGVDGWRQHLPPDSRVHGIITEGGQAMNVVPERADAIWGLRAKELPALERMVETFTKIAEGAAKMTETTVEVLDYLQLYAPVSAHPALGDVLEAELRARGIEPTRGVLVTASTDLGNVSQEVPTDWVRFPVTEAPIAGHSEAMKAASVTDLGHANGWITAEVLAAAAVKVASDPQARERLR